jgi:predicted metal-dependent hydrolase
VPNGTIGYSVRRSTRARRSRLTITDAGQTIVVLPARAPEHEAEDLVRRHRAWIERHTAKITARRRALALRPSLERGRAVTLYGQPREVVVMTTTDRARSRVALDGDGAIRVERSSTDDRPVATLLEAWLRGRARVAIERQARSIAPELGVDFRRITIRDQRTRWGSASRTGTLSFNWRLVLCPPDVLDYVVVHELAHLRISGHGRSFWRLVAKHHAAPDRARRWLRANHDGLRHALD